MTADLLKKTPNPVALELLSKSQVPPEVHGALGFALVTRQAGTDQAEHVNAPHPRSRTEPTQS